MAHAIRRYPELPLTLPRDHDGVLANERHVAQIRKSGHRSWIAWD